MISLSDIRKKQINNTYHVVKPINKNNTLKDISFNFTNNNIIIAPLNSDIDFSTISLASTKDHVGLRSLQKKNKGIPKKWTWKNCPNITPVQKQNKCGSCWAFASAGCVSDTFVIGFKNKIHFNPLISPTYIMINFPQKGCNGGNPAAVLEENIQCFLSESCVDYSWCDQNKYCSSKKDIKYVENSNGLKVPLGDYLNDIIPGPAGACYTKGKHNLFCVNNSCLWGFHLDNDFKSDVSKKINANNITEKEWKNVYEDLFKMHLLNKGTAVTGILIFNNFLSGSWSIPNSYTKGIYFENFDYSKDMKEMEMGKILTIPFFSKDQTSPKKLLGAHAVVIVGWGEETIPFDPQTGKKKKTKVSYWEVRNSWGKDWGGYDGYFKIATYPFNKFCQAEAIRNFVGSKGEKYNTGGMITIEATGGGGDIPENDNEELAKINLEILSYNLPPKLNHKDSFYDPNNNRSDMKNFMKNKKCIPSKVYSGTVEPSPLVEPSRSVEPTPSSSSLSQKNNLLCIRFIVSITVLTIFILLLLYLCIYVFMYL